ncbi:hypothetical protein MSAN_00854600 [Mycena sanguinolenta]|uniref:Uncharacterized protein n=1 Tax=Mycena sanguinolenta TaxID=230812 RepID=A0A8H6YWV5_9AGAR|nr:hypothetical protein MSAN_00854600 [Mycena sanguinolenta]
MAQNNASENTRLLSNSPPPVNHATRPGTTSESESTIMSTFRSVFQIMHGVGENVRGTVLGAVDDWENKGQQKHHEIARQGRAEIDGAFRKLWGTSGSAPPAQDSRDAPATGYDAAPPTYQSTHSGYGTAAGLRPDSKTSSGS